ncbi:MAG: GAF domain-containing protein [Chloroflexi bacterium]|nr:GAF domain-containing protein [Chloroflexota bacterium]
MSEQMVARDKPSAVIATMFIATIFGLGALAVVAAGLTIPIPGTDVVTDPRELFATIGAALTGPIGGVIVGILAGIREPVVVLPSVIAHVLGGLWMGFAYRLLVYERLQTPRRFAGWAALVLAYYYLIVVPGFVIGQAITLPASALQISALWAFLRETYVTIAVGATPEALLTATVTTLVLIAVPRKYHRPLWGGNGKRPRYIAVPDKRVERRPGTGEAREFPPSVYSYGHNAEPRRGLAAGTVELARHIKGTLAWRLVILLTLMSFLPIAVMVIFVRHTVAEALIALESRDTLMQARQLATEVPLLADEAVIQDLLASSSDEHRTSFIAGRDGQPMVLPPNIAASAIALASLTPNTLRNVLSGREGTTSEKDSGVIVAYSPIPRTDAVAVIVMDGSAVADSIQRMESATFVQLGASLLIISIVGGALIWLVMGPIRSLTRAAGQIGAGNFEIEIDPSEMEGELAVLATAFAGMTRQLRESYDTLERRVADRTQELATLNSISAVVSRSLDLAEVLQAAVDRTLEIVNLEVGGAYRLDEETRSLTLLGHRGISEEFAQQATYLAQEKGIVLPGLREGQTVVVREGDPAFEALSSCLERERLKTLVAVPLMAKGKAVGLIVLATRTERQLSAQELSLLAAIGQQVGVAVENARLYEQAEEAAVAAERSRLARDLHDAVTQTLFSASLIAEVLPRLWERSPVEGRRRLEELRQLTRGALAEMRSLLLELRPSTLTEAAPGELLRQLAEATSGRARVPVSVTVEGQAPMPPDVKIAFYRIAQETLNNIAKHANASQVFMSLNCRPDSVELRVSDDGRGFDRSRVSSEHLGLGIMNERAEAIGATLSITSQPGHGTQVLVRWTEAQGGKANV